MLQVIRDCLGNLGIRRQEQASDLATDESVGLAVGDVVEAGTRFGNAEAQTPEHLHVLRVVEHHTGQVGQDVERQISIPEDLRDIARCKLGAVADAAREGVVALELHELH